jgi:hypothetical protein
VALNTISASGSGTVGYMAPEQAMGKPSKASDVFALGLIVYEIFTGKLPEWPFEWPPKGYELAQQRLHPDFLQLLKRCLDLDHAKRYADAEQLLAAYKRLRVHALLAGATRARKKAVPKRKVTQDWREVRQRNFQRLYGKTLKTTQSCEHCAGPIAQTMPFCPWCGGEHKPVPDPNDFPAQCERCGRGRKLDWRFCAWCYGEGLTPETARIYSDKRYLARCHNPLCTRKALMPFMRYCPWCRTKVRRKWLLPENKETCDHCHWGVTREYWSYCPWCGKNLKA